jgi:hypothetical protein
MLQAFSRLASNQEKQDSKENRLFVVTDYKIGVTKRNRQERGSKINQSVKNTVENEW